MKNFNKIYKWITEENSAVDGAMSTSPIVQASIDPNAKVKDQVYGLWSKGKNHKPLKKFKRSLKNFPLVHWRILSNKL